jgi:hypothetical protein
VRKSRFCAARRTWERADSPPAPPRLAGRAHDKNPIMDIERINAIGKRIADLSERTNALRGYL